MFSLLPTPSHSDMTQTASYGAMDHTPLIVNGGPELSKTPPRHRHLCTQHLTTPPTLRKAEPGSVNNSDQFSDDGEEPGRENSSHPVFRLDDN